MTDYGRDLLEMLTRLNAAIITFSLELDVVDQTLRTCLKARPHETGWNHTKDHARRLGVSYQVR
ncbi:MAG: hypothetical protein ACRDRV_03130 [Pseudonocardiaceae bacterium]